MTTLSDFLFEHKLSRYSADDVDRLLCNDPEATALFVLGASSAQGHSATSKLLAWHALLEDALRQKLHKPNLYVFNAAMGGYVAFRKSWVTTLPWRREHRPPSYSTTQATTFRCLRVTDRATPPSWRRGTARSTAIGFYSGCRAQRHCQHRAAE